MLASLTFPKEKKEKKKANYLGGQWGGCQGFCKKNTTPD